MTTRQPGLFANRFSTPKKTVWTLLQHQPPELRGHLMTVPLPARERAITTRGTSGPSPRTSVATWPSWCSISVRVK